MARKQRITKPVQSEENSTPPVADGRAPASRVSVPADRIAARAYERFLARGGDHGNDQEDWLEAERECCEELARATEAAPAEPEAAAEAPRVQPEPEERSQPRTKFSQEFSPRAEARAERQPAVRH